MSTGLTIFWAIVVGAGMAAYIVPVLWFCWPKEAMEDDGEEQSTKEKILGAIRDEMEATIDEVAGKQGGPSVPPVSRSKTR